jgi:glucose dehydrogenase
VRRTLTEDAQIGLLDAELRAIDSDIGKVVLDLRVDGVLSLAGRKEFEDRIANAVGASVCAMRIEDAALVLEPTEADMNDIDRAGFVRTAADRLDAMANDPTDPGRAQIAALALKRLYVEHLREAGSR